MPGKFSEFYVEADGTAGSGMKGSKLGFKLEAGGSEDIKATPDETVDGNDHCGHENGCGNQEAEIAGIGGGADRGTEADGGIGLAFEVEVLGNDAGVPGASGSGDESGDQVREDAGEEEFAPSLEATKMKDVANLF